MSSPDEGPRFIRIDGPSNAEVEEDVADYFEKALAWHDRRHIGSRTRRDGRDASGLRVDFTYEGATPPMALEITGSPIRPIAALGSELNRLEAELQSLTSSEELGSWELAIRVGIHVRSIKAPLMALLRSQRLRDEDAVFREGDAPQDLGDDELRLLDELFGGGLLYAERLAHRGHHIGLFPPIGDGPDHLSGFSGVLEEAIAENIAKLKDTKPRETHLVVTLDRPVSANAADTPVPRLPEGLDFLWALLGYWNAKWTYRLWRTGASDTRWLMLMHPYGDPPVLHPPL